MLIGTVRSLHRYPVKSMAGESLNESQVGHDGLLGDRAFALRDEQAGELRSARKWPRLLQCSARYRSEPGVGALPPADITLPDGTTTCSDDPRVSELLSRWLGLSATFHARRPASDKQHYRRANLGASAAGLLAKSPALSKVLNRLARVGANGDQMRQEFGREDDEPLPDLSGMPGVFEYVSPPGTYFDAFPIHVITSASLASLRARHPGGDWDPRRFRANVIIESNGSQAGYPEAAWSGRALRIGEVELACVVATPRCNMVMQAQGELPKDALILRTIVREAEQNLGVYARVTRAGRVRVGDSAELG